jgi:hypothetical protein
LQFFELASVLWSFRKVRALGAVVTLLEYPPSGQFSVGVNTLGPMKVQFFEIN